MHLPLSDPATKVLFIFDMVFAVIVIVGMSVYLAHKIQGHRK